MTKVSLFYIIEDMVDDPGNIFDWLEWDLTPTKYIQGKAVRLYGWTADKKVKNLFMKQRNMKKFIIRNEKIEDIEYSEMTYKYHDYMLTIENFIHGKGTITFALSGAEYDTIIASFDYADEDFQDVCMDMDTMSIIFDIMREKYQKYLKGMGLFYIFDICEDLSIGDYPAIQVNVLHMMLNIYGFTFM